MFPHISSLNTSSTFHGPSLIHRRASLCALTCKCIKDTPFNNGNSDRPLIIFHSFVPVDPLSVGPVKFDFLPPSKSFSSVPFSLRFVQLRKKRSSLPLPKTPPPNLCALGASVLYLASIIAETQKLFFPNNSSSDVSSCTDTGYSIIWLFHKVFVTSPALTVGILSLMGQFVNVAINREIGWVLADLEWKKRVQAKKAEEEEKKFESWSEIGINMEEQELVVEADVIAMSDRKRITYERLIVCNEGTSLILSNYAQFLYQIQKDYDR